ncbi:MAG: 30S ribosome-binding factor RbfA [Planctomycetes bacterium]|nr:30S ribosome-binding factor RbfA [Planctomycetota bacterium]
MASRGLQRLQDAILRKAATVIQRDLADPRIGMVTVTRAKLSTDFETCILFWSCLEEGGARRRTAAAMTAATPYVQRAIAESMRLRRAPIITFAFDDSIEGVDRMTRLIRDARAEDDARHETPAIPASDATTASETGHASGSVSNPGTEPESNSDS